MHNEKKKKLIIASCRLPVKISENYGTLEFVKSEGGLATGLHSLETEGEKIWIGWPGKEVTDPDVQQKITSELNKTNIIPVFLTSCQISSFYEGYSNSTIWPMFHYFYVYTHYKKSYWESYVEVNRLFYEKIASVYSKGDIIWVHDYQLMLVPGMLRQRFPDACIGFFLHIPFPSYELFRILPERREILKGLLGSTLIGFHTTDYMRHFISSVYRILDLDFRTDKIVYENNYVHVATFPMGINFNRFYRSSEQKTIRKHIEEFRDQYGHTKIVLSVDRLDYSKGILHRIKAFGQFLEEYPEFRKKVTLILIVAPSRASVEKYQDLKIEIDKTIGSINGIFSEVDWIPIHYFYRSFDFEQLAALYYISDVALITPLRDGMNLIAKEYIATKKKATGVLILSEMAGSSLELKDAIIVNPNNLVEIIEALRDALLMPGAEKRVRLRNLQRIIKNQNVRKWSEDFIRELLNARSAQQALNSKLLNKQKNHEIVSRYRHAKSRLFFLDYDGTLVGFSRSPLRAAPDEELKRLLQKLTADQANRVIIMSGRDQKTLEKWLGKLPVKIVAEHGAFLWENNEWKSIHTGDSSWKDEIKPLINFIADRTPGSFLEEKRTALVWHYRNADIWLAELREKQLMEMLVFPCSRLNLQIMRGSKILEVKMSNVNKGIASRNFVNENDDFLLAIGDDQTDEDMFSFLPDDAITIRVGFGQTHAKYLVNSYREVRHFLFQLINSKNTL